MHEKNIALLCDEADRLLQLNINLLRQMVEEPDVLSDSKNENRLLFDKQKALKRIEELEGEQIKTARREMVLAVVGTMKAGKSTTINAIVGQEILPKPLAARQALTRSEAVLQKSLDITEEADLALRNAMARIK
ncbi:hypothetical protein E2P18_18565 [Escherichia coli]|nr:hypothetical protein [Escherichia coli]